MKFQIKIFTLLTLVLWLASLGCVRRQKASLQPFQLKLHSGVASVAQLGESEATVLKRARWSYRRLPSSSIAGVDTKVFDQVIQFSEIGVRVYFRYDVVVLLEIQSPFKGTILGKNLKLFPFELKDWRKILVREFGPPKLRRTGGRMGAEALYYGWGDVAFSSSGPNEIALYRLPEVKKYRSKNFGRVLELFQTK